MYICIRFLRPQISAYAVGSLGGKVIFVDLMSRPHRAGPSIILTLAADPRRGLCCLIITALGDVTCLQCLDTLLIVLT